MKKRLALLLAVVMAASALTACGSKEVANQLAVQVGPNPETIDPALNSAVDGAIMILHASEGLLVISEEGFASPGQAESWEVSEDGLTYTFHLREGLKWSDGSALTANDFVYSWKRVCDPAVAAPYADTVLSMVAGFEEAQAGNLDALAVSAPDDNTFVVELAAGCPYFLDLAAFPTLSPVQQATVEANGDAWATKAATYITNGAFQVTEWVPGSHITMSKNKNYWNADAVKLDSLKFVLMEDSNAAYSAFKAGEVQMIKDVPTEEIPSLLGSDEFIVAPLMGTYYICMNRDYEVFDEVNVRKALSLAIDRDYVANVVMQGTYSPAYNFMGPGWTDAGDTLFVDNANGGTAYISSDHEANLAEAKRLLAEAGHENGEGLPTIVYSTNDTAYNKPVAEYLQQAWSELGLTVEVDIMEWASFTPARRAGQYMIARNGWAGDYSDASNQLELFYSSNGNNDGKYNNPDFDAMIDASRATVDENERSIALHAAEDIVMDDVAGIPVAYYNEFWLQKTNVKGSWHSVYGYWYFMYAELEK